MTSHARIFFAGVGTTFVILAIGFGGGVLLATSAVQDNGSAVKRPPQLSQTTVPATRVVHPASREVAQVTADVPKPQLPSVQASDQLVSAPEPPQTQPHEHQKTRRELRAEKRRERAERLAERRARRYHWEPLRQQEPAMMAFGNY